MQMTRRRLVGALLLAGLVVTTVRVQELRYRPYLHEAMYLPSGRFIEQVSLGYRQLSADIIWFAAIQYYGDYRQGNHSLSYFNGLIDIVTTLDPHFVFAYIFGALVVSEDVGRFDDGVEILKRGMANNPTSWRLPFEVGFLSFLNGVDYDLAARYFDLASRIPGAPEKTRRFAAYVYGRAGEERSAIQLWTRYRDEAEEQWLKELATRYIEKLESSGGRAAGDTHE